MNLTAKKVVEKLPQPKPPFTVSLIREHGLEPVFSAHDLRDVLIFARQWFKEPLGIPLRIDPPAEPNC